ncbi:uncharacterized protein EI90DRAFT_3291774 [Cantharellus anzutake]|uniref:uncharacterized protein n=1 Tax=Cantharellus anzutake TaxID=1750568 RepID=UPI0019061E17|nr:uncharacterized protein EI90DRAFT_3291774 [Cantharellus anzutake]KAF8325331.1 hypothetical protein EI90DRAFT_3291774 [Cantharellus anzutake]
MASVDVWDHDWVPPQLSQIKLYLESHRNVSFPPLEELTAGIVHACESGIHEWQEYCTHLTEKKDKEYAGMSERSPSLESSNRFRGTPARMMFHAVFFGLLKTRLAVMWMQHSPRGAYPTPITMPISPQENSLADEHKRNISYWKLRSRLAFFDDSLENDIQSSVPAQTAQEPSSSSNAASLLKEAESRQDASRWHQIAANVLYAAWGLRRILDSSEFLNESITWEKKSSGSAIIGPLALAVCISPLTLLIGTTMTKPGCLPTWTSLANHICKGASFPSMSDAEVVMESAILHVVVETCKRGQLVLQDFEVLKHARMHVKIAASPPPSSPIPNPHQQTAAELGPRSCKRSQQQQSSKQSKKPRTANKHRTGKGKGKHSTGGEGPEGGSSIPEPEGDGDLRNFISEFRIPDLEDLQEHWPKLIAPPSSSSLSPSYHSPSFSSPSPSYNLPPRLKALNTMCLPCTSTESHNTYKWVLDDFGFPHYPDSPLYSQEPIKKLSRLLESEALDTDWRPRTMMEAEAFTMPSSTFQSIVNNEGLVLMVGPPGNTPKLDLYDLLSLKSKGGVVECFNHAGTVNPPDSDHSRTGEDDEKTTWEPLDKVVHEISNWKTSRPLVVHHLKGVIRLPVESLLNTFDDLMFNSMDEGHLPEDYPTWRTPMLAAAGSYTAPHQDPDGVGTILHCYAGYKLLFFPVNMHPDPLIVKFDDIDFGGAIGLEYLFHLPYRTNAVRLSSPLDDLTFLTSGDSIMAPGQIHFVFTLSKCEVHEEPSIGALMHGSFFLSSRCMTRSFHSSWVDRLLQSQREGASDRCDTVAALLSAFVHDSQERVHSGHPIRGDPEPKEIFSAMFMALMYHPRPDRKDTAGVAKSIILHYAETHRKEFKDFRNDFNKVQAANLANPACYPGEVAELRRRMKLAVQSLISSMEPSQH